MNTSEINAMALPITSSRMALFTVFPDMFFSFALQVRVQEQIEWLPPKTAVNTSLYACSPPSMAPSIFGGSHTICSRNIVSPTLR